LDNFLTIEQEKLAKGLVIICKENWTDCVGVPFHWMISSAPSSPSQSSRQLPPPYQSQQYLNIPLLMTNTKQLSNQNKRKKLAKGTKGKGKKSKKESKEAKEEERGEEGEGEEEERGEEEEGEDEESTKYTKRKTDKQSTLLPSRQSPRMTKKLVNYSEDPEQFNINADEEEADRFD